MADTDRSPVGRFLDAADLLDRRLMQLEGICCAVAAADTKSDGIPDDAIANTMLAARDLIEQAKEASTRMYAPG